MPTDLSHELAVSSLGAPEMTVTQFLDLAVQHRCGAVELRASEGQPISSQLEPEKRQQVRRQVEERGLHLLAVASYVRVCEPVGYVLDQLRRHIDLAHDLGAHAVRVFPGGAGSPVQRADARAIERLGEMAPYAAEAGVVICLETHDSHAAGADVARVLGALDRDLPGHGVKVVWDVMHPLLAGEDPAATAEVLKPWLDWVQIKDAISSSDGPVPALVGSGQLPLAQVAAALSALDYQGWVCLEWEKAWFPELPELAEALSSAEQWLQATAEQRHGSA